MKLQEIIESRLCRADVERALRNRGWIRDSVDFHTWRPKSGGRGVFLGEPIGAACATRNYLTLIVARIAEIDGVPESDVYCEALDAARLIESDPAGFDGCLGAVLRLWRNVEAWRTRDKAAAAQAALQGTQP